MRNRSVAQLFTQKSSDYNRIHSPLMKLLLQQMFQNDSLLIHRPFLVRLVEGELEPYLFCFFLPLFCGLVRYIGRRRISVVFS